MKPGGGGGGLGFSEGFPSPLVDGIPIGQFRSRAEDRTRSLAYAQEPADGMRRRRRTDGRRQQLRTNEVARRRTAAHVAAAAAMRSGSGGAARWGRQGSPALCSYCRGIPVRDRGAEGRRLRRVRVRIRWGEEYFYVEWAGI
jgi:hypothetical protein